MKVFPIKTARVPVPSACRAPTKSAQVRSRLRATVFEDAPRHQLVVRQMELRCVEVLEYYCISWARSRASDGVQNGQGVLRKKTFGVPGLRCKRDFVVRLREGDTATA